MTNFAQTMEFFFQRFENIVGKRRKCWLPAFSPFPTMFFGCFHQVRLNSSKYKDIVTFEDLWIISTFLEHVKKAT